MNFNNNINNLIYILFILLLFLLPGCINKQKINNIPENNFLISNLIEATSQEMILNGFHILPNSENIKSFITDDILVYEFKLKKIKSKNEYLDLKKILLILENLYINDGWVISEKIYSDNYLSFYGKKPEKHLSIVLIINEKEYKINSTITK